MSRSIQPSPGANPVHQMTLATSRTRPSSRAGKPFRTWVVLGSNSTPAAARSLRLVRTSGAPLAKNRGMALRPIGDARVSTWFPANRTRGRTKRAALVPCLTGSCPTLLPDSDVGWSAKPRGRSRPGVAGADHEGGAILQLPRAAVLVECSCTMDGLSSAAKSGMRDSGGHPRRQPRCRPRTGQRPT